MRCWFWEYLCHLENCPKPMKRFLLFSITAIIGLSWLACAQKTSPSNIVLTYICFENPLDIRLSFQNPPTLQRDTTDLDNINMFGMSKYQIHIDRADTVFWKSTLCKQLNELGVTSELVIDNEHYCGIKTKSGSHSVFIVLSKESYFPIAYFTNHGRVKLLYEVHNDANIVPYTYYIEAGSARRMFAEYKQLQEENSLKNPLFFKN